MLSDKKLKSFIPTVMPEKAKAFYRDVLGLKLLSEDDYASEFDANGVLLRITTVPSLKPQEFTVLGWNVPDIASLIRLMNSKGIFCEKYYFLDQDSLGIWNSPGGSKVAWFKDPDGNLLSLTEL
jgi:catechol 2,3-dioxygenase-like lactoylglutathione lyase family enzyme